MTIADLENTSFELVAGTSATLAAGGAETYPLADGDTLVVSIDGGADQIVSFVAGDFVDISVATAAEVEAVLTAQLTGAVGNDNAGTVEIVSLAEGAVSSVKVQGGTANAALAFPTTITTGVSDRGRAQGWTLSAVNTAEEVAEFTNPATTEDAFEDFEVGWGATPVGPLDDVEDGLFSFVDGPYLVEDFDSRWGLNPARIQSEAKEPYNVGTSDTLTISVDGAPAQTVTLNNGFITPGAATAEEIVLEIAADLTGATPSTDPAGEVVRIATVSEGQGPAVSIQVTGGTANAELQFPTNIRYGSAINGPIVLGALEAGVFHTAPNESVIESFEREWSGNEDYLFALGTVQDATFSDGVGSNTYDSFEGGWRDNHNYETSLGSVEAATFLGGLDSRDSFETTSTTYALVRILTATDGVYAMNVDDQTYIFDRQSGEGAATIASELADEFDNAGAFAPEMDAFSIANVVYIRLNSSGRWSSPDELPLITVNGPTSSSIRRESPDPTAAWYTKDFEFPF